MATNKKKKGKKPAAPPLFSLKPNNLIVKKGRSMPIFECWKTMLGMEGGKSDILVARRMPNGHLAVGFYLVDLWCLGLKDTFYKTDITIAAFRELLDGMGGPMMEQMKPALAFNMIYAAVEYAEDLGFEPHKEFKTTQYLLPEPDDFEYIEIETGHLGKPCYYPGPDDRVEAVLAKLDKKVGKGNYAFDSWGDPRIHGFGDEEEDELRVETKARFFPEKKVDKKLETLTDEAEKSAFLLQTVIATLALQFSKGSMGTLFEQHEEEDFVYDILVEYEDILNEIREADGLEPLDFDDDVREEQNLGFIRLILGRIARHKSVDFMFEDKYRPMPLSYTPEETANLSPEELSDYMADSFNLMTEDEKTLSNIRLMTFVAISEIYGQKGPGHINLEAQQTIEKKVWEKIKAKDENDNYDENDEDFMEEFRASVALVVESFNDPDRQY